MEVIVVPTVEPTLVRRRTRIGKHPPDRSRRPKPLRARWLVASECREPPSSTVSPAFDATTGEPLIHHANHATVTALMMPSVIEAATSLRRGLAEAATGRGVGRYGCPPQDGGASSRRGPRPEFA